MKKEIREINHRVGSGSCLWSRCGRQAMAAGLLTMVLGSAFAAEDARAIVDKADQANTPAAMRETMKMMLRDESGKEFHRRLVLSTKKGEEGDLEMMRFLSPDEIRGAGLLTLEHRGGQDDQWFYLPATRKIRRIAGSDRRNRFMGTEFLYEDLQGYHPEDWTFTLVGSEKVNGEDCHRIVAVPKDEKAASRSAYSKKELFIGKGTSVLHKAIFFDAEGKELKILTASDVKEASPGIWLPGKVLIENKQSGRTTSIETVLRELPETMSDNIFSQRNLRRRLRPDEK